MKRQIQKSRSRVLKAELIKPGEFVEVQTDGTINPPRKVEKSRMMLGCVFWVTTRMGCKACKELEHTPLYLCRAPSPPLQHIQAGRCRRNVYMQAVPRVTSTACMLHHLIIKHCQQKGVLNYRSHTSKH